MFERSLTVIVNRRGEPAEPLLRLCEEAILGGAGIIQYRDKEGPDVAIGRALADLCHTHGLSSSSMTISTWLR